MTPAFLDDRRVNLTDDTDVFGHRDYAAALASAVTEAPTGFTFGLFGPWGLGKSTVLATLADQLSTRSETVYVEFDAWRYEHDAFRREFLRVVAEQIEESKALRGFDPSSDLRDLDVDVTVPQERLTLSFRHAARNLVGVAALALVWVLVGGQLLDTEKVALSLLAVLPLVTYLATRVEQVVAVQTINVSHRRLEDPDRFAARFRKLLGAVTARRLVIAIDNLDRCSPEAAVEVLATIKTYLEPELGADRPTRSTRSKRVLGAADRKPPTVVFVIAADHDALRRHLMNRMPDASAKVGNAREYADEYLRKFFDVTTTLRPLLDDDLRDYVQRYLEPLVERWPAKDPASLGLTSDKWREREVSRLVTLVAAGLRHNPRRVKQYTNNLEMGLRLLREREDAGKLVEPLSSEVAFVGKLVLLQEEWPERLAELQEDHTLLARWEAHVKMGDEPEGWDSVEWAMFARFLRSGRNVQSERLRGFLRLKLSREELSLPEYDRFREAVVSADERELNRLPYGGLRKDHRDGPPRPAGEHDTSVGYAARLPAILREELAESRIEAALNVVRAALTVPALAAHEAPRKEVVEQAVTHSELKRHLLSLEPQRLAEAAYQLEPPERETMFELLAERFAAEGTSRAERAELAPLLAEAVSRQGGTAAARIVSATAEALVREALDRDDVAADFELCLLLANSRPQLLGPRALTKALEALDALGRTIDRDAALVGEPDRLRRSAEDIRRREIAAVRVPDDHPSFRILHLAAVAGQAAEQPDKVYESLTHVLRHAGALAVAESDVSIVLPMVSYLSSLLPELPEPAPAALDELSDAILAVKRSAPTQQPFVHLAGQVLDRIPADRSSAAEELLAEWEPSEWLTYLRGCGEELPGSLRLLMFRHLRELGAGAQPPEFVGEAMRFLDLESMATDIEPERVADAVEASVHRSQQTRSEGITSVSELRPLDSDAWGLETYCCWAHLGGNAEAGERVAVRITARLRRDAAGVVHIAVSQLAPLP